MTGSEQESYDFIKNETDPVTIIRLLNDGLRCRGLGGQLAITRGVLAMGQSIVPEVVEAVRSFDAFTPDNDPYGEHDFGSIEITGSKIFWKIDYYDRNLQWGSPDPADPAVTTRVLTVMLASEY